MKTGCRGGNILPPFIPRAELMPVHGLCSLALQWHKRGFVQEASHLAHWLLPLKPFPSLWCSEKEYNEKEANRLFSLLSEIEPVAGNIPDFNLTLLQNSSLSAAFTLSGRGTSIGALCSANVEIRAMGPQVYRSRHEALFHVDCGINSFQFGIRGEGSNHWAQCAPLSEVWLEIKPRCSESACQLDLRFVGLESPLSFAFYVKAQNCQVGNEILKPKNLQRFNGEVKSVKLDHLVICSSSAHKVEVIPLAGEGCFWDSEFLVSFEIHPFAPQASFSIN